MPLGTLVPAKTGIHTLVARRGRAIALLRGRCEGYPARTNDKGLSLTI